MRDNKRPNNRLKHPCGGVLAGNVNPIQRISMAHAVFEKLWVIQIRYLVILSALQ